VLKALTRTPYEEPLPPEMEGMGGLEMLGLVGTLAPGATSVPGPLAELSRLTPRFAGVVDAGKDGVEGAVREWLAG
jgi:hypothetical protein